MCASASNTLPFFRTQVSLDVPTSSIDSIGALAKDVCTGDRAALSQAITLAESTRTEHQEQARALLDRLLPHAGESLRVGITGVSGVGKSTFIEALGTRLTEQGRRLAVLAIDPTSERSGGSILGDRTRMEKLSSSERAFIRPSPTGGTLGGVARKTREAILLCEAAGYDTIFVETVGVGQAETSVHALVDFFLLLALPGGGDELQGIKRGVMEMADALVVTKADSANREAAKAARAAYEGALRLFPDTDSGWDPPALTCSALTGEGINEVWATVEAYEEEMRASGYFDEQRRRQTLHWMHEAIEHRLHETFFSDEAVSDALDDVETRVLDGSLGAAAGAEELLERYRRNA